MHQAPISDIMPSVLPANGVGRWYLRNSGLKENKMNKSQRTTSKMKKVKTTKRTSLGLMSILLFVCILSRVTAAEHKLHKKDLFVGGIAGYNTYRIPSLIVTQKGTILAFCEGRKFDSEDNSPTDIILKRSEDGGKTWSPTEIVVSAVPDAVTGPTTVIDRTTGIIFMGFCRTPKGWKVGKAAVQNQAGLGMDSYTVWMTKSGDDGRTWSKPVNITRTTKKPAWKNVSLGPGRGIQLQSGRLVMPSYTEGVKLEGRSYSVYSDDHGETWKMGNLMGSNTSECQVIELVDGRLMMDIRCWPNLSGCRWIAFSNDGGVNWSKTQPDNNRPDPGCMGSIIRYTKKSDAFAKNRILASNPATTYSAAGRIKVTVRISYDEGKTWPASKLLEAGPSGYSCLAVLPDGDIICIYEGAKKAQQYPGEKLVFTRFSLEWLTNGKDELQKKFSEKGRTPVPAVRDVIDFMCADGLAPDGLDNMRDDTAALTAALAAGPGVVRIGPGYYRIGNVTIPSKVSVVGAGAATVIRSNGAKRIFNQVRVSEWMLRDLVLDGQAKRVRDAKQGSYGIYVEKSYGFDIRNVTAHHFEGAAVEFAFTDRAVWQNGGTISGLTVHHSYAGIVFNTRAEFITATQIKSYSNKFGCILNAGNVLISDSFFNANDVGFWLKDKANGSHGSVSCSHFVHNRRHAILAEDVVWGHSFIGCNIGGGGDIKLVNCKGIRITSGWIECALIIKGEKANLILGNYMIENRVDPVPKVSESVVSPSTLVKDNFTENGPWKPRRL